MAKQIAVQVKTPGPTLRTDGQPSEWVAFGPPVRATVAESRQQLIKQSEIEYRKTDLVVYIRWKRGEPINTILTGQNIRIEAVGKVYEILWRKELTPPKIKWVGLGLGEVGNG